jgi:hypothetical protein
MESVGRLIGCMALAFSNNYRTDQSYVSEGMLFGDLDMHTKRLILFSLFTSVLLETCIGLARSIDRLKRRLDGLPHRTFFFFFFFFVVCSVFD